MISFIQENSTGIYVFLIYAFYVCGFIFAIHALMNCRTPQGTIAWILSLIAFPFIAIPLYLIFGRNKFYGYVESLQAVSEEFQAISGERLKKFYISSDESSLKIRKEYRVFEKLIEMPFTSGNKLKLLTNGKMTFPEIFEAVDKAKEYILVQFYIVNDDKTGKEFKQKLIEKAKQGLKVYFLFDEIGCSSLPQKYVDEMNSYDNIEVHAFQTRQGFKNRFQLNFRNHRKIIVIDGTTAFVGGLNIGDEYLGKNKKIGFWRDTHCKVSGPSAIEFQLSFIKDWYWACRKLPELNWESTQKYSNGNNVLAVPTGPADSMNDSCILFFMEIIRMAKNRLWISTPYFVPDPSITDALKLAAMRGVDVRILIPDKADLYLPHLATYSYLPEVKESGIKIFRYTKGFIHQKVVLVDNDLSCIGSANFDNRSMRLNFEISLLCEDTDFALEVENMLIDDFKESTTFEDNDYWRKNFWFRILVKLIRLFAPVL